MSARPGISALSGYLGYSIYLAGFFYFYLWLAGDSIAKRFLPEVLKLPRLERDLLAVGIGCVAMSVLSQLFGMVGLFRPICLAGFLILSFPFLLSRADLTAFIADGSGDNVGVLRSLLWIIVAPLSVCLLVSLLPVIDWDEASYHLPTVIELLKRGWLHSDIERFPLNFPLATHTLYAYLLSFNSDAAVRVFNFGSGGLLLCATFRFATRLFDSADFLARRLPYLAVALLASCPIIWEVCTTARIEVILSLWILLGFLCWQIGRDEQSLALRVLSFLFFGMAAGAKTTGLIFVVVPVCMLSVGIVCDRTLAVKERSKWCAVGVFLFLLPSAFWYLRNAVVFSAPLYPVSVSNLRVDPTYEGQSIFKLTDGCFSELLQEGVAEKFQVPVTRDLAGLVDRIKPKLDKITLRDLPGMLLFQRMFERKPLHTFNLVLIVGLLAPLFWISRRWKAAWVLIVALLSAACYFAILSSQLRIVRYLILLFPFLSIAAAAVILSMFGSLVRYRLGQLLANAVVAGLCLVCAYLAITSFDQKLKLIKFKQYLRGEESHLDFTAKNGFNYVNHSYAELARYLNRSVPEWGTALLFAESKGFYFSIDYIPDHEQLGRYGITWLRLLAESRCDLKQIPGTLSRRGITHVVLNHGVLRYTLNTDPPADLDRLKRSILSMLLYLEGHGKLVLVTSDYLVWEVSASSDRR